MPHVRVQRQAEAALARLVPIRARGGARESMLAWLCYAVVAIVWGSTFFAIKIAVVSFTPYGLVATRFVAAGLLAALVAWRRGESLPSRENLISLSLTGILMLTGANGLVSWAEQYVASGLAATICAMLPLFLAVLGGDRQGKVGWIGLILGLLGVAIIANPLEGSVDLVGVAAVFVGNLCWASGTLLSRRRSASKSYFANNAVQMLAAGIAGAVVAVPMGGFVSGPMTSSSLFACLYLVVFGSLLAFSAYMYLASAWSPAKMGTYAYFNPVVAVLLGTFLGGESMGPGLVVGMCFILAGVALVQFGPIWRRNSMVRLGKK